MNLENPEENNIEVNNNEEHNDEEIEKGQEEFNKMVEEYKQANYPEMVDPEENDDVVMDLDEEYKEKSFYGTTNFRSATTEDFSSQIKLRRTQMIKLVIIRPRKEFESPISFNDKSPGEEGGVSAFDIKPVRTNEYPMNDQAFLEIGLQTANQSNVKSYQVPKTRVQNAFTQVEPGLQDIVDKFENKAQFCLTNAQKLVEIENFLHKVRPRMEESLQSNETIDIFLNDFDLDRTTFISNTDVDGKGEKQPEVRTFRDNVSAGQKSKREKSVNHIRLISNDEFFIAHSLIRNLTFEERTRTIGIPYQSQILFWNFIDPEINSPVFSLEIPMEISSFEFCPTNSNLLVCALFSGQLIIYEINDLMGILLKSNDSEHQQLQKKSKFSHKIFSKQERSVYLLYYTYI